MVICNLVCPRASRQRSAEQNSHSISTKKMKQKCDKKAIEILIIYNGVGICVYFVLMRFSHFLVPLYRNLMVFYFFCRAFLLHFWLIFKEIPDSYMLQPLFGHSWGDVKWRLFAPACPCIIRQNPSGTRTKNIIFRFFLGFQQGNHHVKYHKH